jgi:hypothetical protein
MCKISGVSLNGKFDDIVRVNDREVKANVKKLDKDVSFEKAQEYLKENPDGYDNVGVVADGEKYIVSVVHDNSKAEKGLYISGDSGLSSPVIYTKGAEKTQVRVGNAMIETSDIVKVELGSSDTQVMFVENENNTEGEVEKYGQIGRFLGFMGGTGLTGVVLTEGLAVEPKIAVPVALAVGVGTCIAGHFIGSYLPGQKEGPTDKLSDGSAFSKPAVGSIVLDPALLQKFYTPKEGE